MKHILNFNSSYYETSIEKTTDPLHKLLYSGIECQFFKHSSSALPLNFTNVTLIPTTPKECTWKWIQDGANTWKGAFNITLHQTQEQSLNCTDQNKDLKSINYPEEDVMMALTCWLPSPSLSKKERMLQKVKRRQSMKDPEQKVGTKPGVTFAAPFILRKTFDSTRRQLHPNAIVLDRNTSIAILSASVSLMLFVFVFVVGYRFFRRKKDKR